MEQVGVRNTNDYIDYQKYYTINTDTNNPHATGIYALVPYKLSKAKNYANTLGASFYYERNDSTKYYFNYFRSATEALLFLSEMNWELVTVISEANWTTGQIFIESRPVYYFKKEIE